MDFRADLHCHSSASDGSDEPLELLRLAKEAGLQGLSITDHDTIDAYTPELFQEAKRLSIELLTGVELSTELGVHSVHLLGYGFPVDSPSFRSFLERMQEGRQERNRKILKKLQGKKMAITEEELLAFAARKREKRSIGRPHIAELLVEKRYVTSTQEAFALYLREGASCYAPGGRISPEEAIQALHEAKGKAVLAHPHFLPKGALLKQLLHLPFDGIECYYGRLSEELELPWVELAKERGFLATGGSDYHGALKPHIPLGASWVNRATFDSLRNPKE